MHQLIVLGNGFDLACGLRSRFSDFYKTRYDDSGKWRLNEDEETAWDVILSSEKADSPWCNIEDAVAEWVAGDDVKIETISVLGLLFPDLKDDDPNPDSVQRSIEMIRQLAFPPHMVSYSISSISKTDSSKTDSSKTDSNNDGGFIFLLSELHRFEKAFADYLFDEVCRSSAYEKKSRAALEILASDKFSTAGSLPPTSVIDFNYTNVVLPRGFVAHNVHGTLVNDNIVIGIDAKGIEDGSPALPFTKTYRLLALDPIMHGSLVHPAGSFDHTSIIKFFGHSLAPADYSYFQAIFDAVDIYGSNVTLGFYYSGYKDSSGKDVPDEKLREEQYKRVTRLLETYGKTFDNKARGSNLMHKLLLEGRLYIKRIAFPTAS